MSYFITLPLSFYFAEQPLFCLVSALSTFSTKMENFIFYALNAIALITISKFGYYIFT